MGENSVRVVVGGWIIWSTIGSVDVSPAMRSTLTFNSMSLPHLTPEIHDVRIYRADGSQIERDDTVEPGDRIRVECVVRNSNTAAVSDGYSEQFPMHVKLVNTDKYPTQGLTPFVDGSHPVQVKQGDGNFSTVATSATADTIAGNNGVPVTLVGNTPVTVSWWAEISGSEGGAVTLSQQLIEDSFQGSQYSTVELVDEHPLTPGDGSGSGEAGKDYHYTRLPAANANGWNTSPVTVTFYPGDYDVMDLTPSEGDAKSLTAADPSWTRAADTAGIDLNAQARNSSTNTVSVQKAGKVKIDTSAPRIEAAGGTLSDWTLTDVPSDASKATSGIWRLHRTDSTGAVNASARAAVFREFSLTGDAGDRKGEPTQAVSALPNGYYVAEDAAGNLSAVLKVGDTEPPAVDRPADSIVDPDDPNPPTPVGPAVGPGDKVPSPTVTEDGEGLKHAVVEETVTEMIDSAAPPFEGLLEKSEASAMMDYRYAASSSAGVDSISDELLDASGNPVASFDTKSPGTCIVKRVITDSQGNTTTILLHYRTVRDSCPIIRPLEPTDPSDPSGPSEPGEPLAPTGPVSTNSDGTQSVEVACEVTEAVTHGTMDAAGAEALLRRHFLPTDVDGGSGITVTVQSMANAAGNRVSVIDTSRAADYLITYLVRDAAGNTTTVRLTYHLVSSHVPGVVVTPDPGTDPNPQPGDDPLNPRPRPIDPVAPPTVAPDGTQHADIEDEMRVPVQDGESLTLADARSLVERRYSFTPEGGGAMTELSLVLTDAKGAAVSSIDLSRPGSWRITYKVADANGNTITVRLRYLVVSDPPTVTPTNPTDPSNPNGPLGPGAKPLEPTSIVVDEETGLSHAVVEDHMITGTYSEPATADTMAALFAERYQLKSALSDGKLTAGPMRLYDAAGNAVVVIDRSKPGTWLAEQVFTDSAGNTTTILLTYEVQESTIDGNGSGDSDGSGNGGDGSAAGDGTGKLRPSGWASRLTQLPQTGGPFGACPLHMMFVLLMLLTSAYGMMRLRQNQRDARREGCCETC